MVTIKLISRIISVLLASVLLIGIVAFPTSASAAGILYVTPTGGGDCYSWANACGLQTALANATDGDDLWVMAGVYRLSYELALKNGVAIYGGFAGTETLLAQRDPAANTTVISGDIGIPDNSTDNLERVIFAYNVDSTTVLDGFTITGGHGGTIFTYGAGMVNFNSDPILTNLIFTGNQSSYGGAMYNHGSNPTLTNVVFDGNIAMGSGGGLYNDGSSPILNNVTFKNNIVSDSGIGGIRGEGGGMYNIYGEPTMTNVTFENNHAPTGGGMSGRASSMEVKISNSVFINNSADIGGGFYNGNYSGYTNFVNVTFANNSGGGIANVDGLLVLNNVTIAGNQGDGIYNDGTAWTHNMIIWGNTTGIYETFAGNTMSEYGIIQGGCPETASCVNIFDSDPLLGLLGYNGGVTQTIPISKFSPAIDVGDDATCATTDQRGILRPQGKHCDIGAYEFTDNIPPVVTAIAPAGATFTKATSVKFNVTFSESVTGVDKSDFALLVTGTITEAQILSVSGGGSTRTVKVNTGAGSGTIQLNLFDNDSIKDAASNVLNGDGLGNGDFTTGNPHTIDKTKPNVLSITGVDASPTDLASVNFIVTFSENVTGVDIKDFKLIGTGSLAKSKPVITAVNGSGATYTVTATTGTSTAPGTMRLDLMANKTIKDTALNLLTASFKTGLPYVVDRAPVVVSILRSNPNATKLATVKFTVKFSEAVTGVDAGDFNLSTTLTGTSIVSITGSGTTWVVTVNTGTGSGTLGLNLVDNDTILDTSGNKLGGDVPGDGNFTGQVYNVR